MWVEFVVGSLACSERFFTGYSGFPLSSKTNISKFTFTFTYVKTPFFLFLAQIIKDSNSLSRSNVEP